MKKNDGKTHNNIVVDNFLTKTHSKIVVCGTGTGTGTDTDTAKTHEKKIHPNKKRKSYGTFD